MSTIIATRKAHVKLTVNVDGEDVSLGTVGIELPYTYDIDHDEAEKHPDFRHKRVPVYARIATDDARKAVGEALTANPAVPTVTVGEALTMNRSSVAERVANAVKWTEKARTI